MNLQYTFHLIDATRKNMLKITDQFSEEQLNKIPDGFRNNLIWNMGHVLVTQELLCYGLSGNKGYVPEKMIADYRKGTCPDNIVESTEVKLIRDLLSTSNDQLISDYNSGMFHSIKAYQTSYGVGFDTIEKAIQFDVAHEAMHLGTMLSIIKFL